MNKETVNLPRLISEVAAGASVEPASARRFLHELFALIETSLQSGESVKIKGVGTFVRSDDVENPIRFQPDEELAAIANEPFAAFSAVELNDGAAEEIMNVTKSAPISNVANSAQAEEPEGTVGSDVPTPDDEKIAEVSEISETQPQQPTSEVENVEADASERDKTELQPEIADTEEIRPEKQEQPTVESNAVEQAEEPTPQMQNVTVHEAGGNTMMWLVLGGLIGLILGLVGGYFAGKTMAAYQIPEDEEEAESVELYEPEMQTDSVQAKASTAVAAAPADSVRDDAKPAQQPVAEQKPAAKKEPVYDTITKTRYLSILAREHYGKKKYWVFIYQANPQLGDPNRVNPGTRVLIPDKESFMESSPEATDAKAQKLLNQLAKKYKL